MTRPDYVLALVTVVTSTSMDSRRRILGVAAAVVVMGGLPIARPAAQTQCARGDETQPGPICSTLQVPNTHYEVLDADPGSDRIAWSATTISCGNFHASSTGVDESGEDIDDETGRNSFWSHANGPPDNCSHGAGDHPGTVVADITRGEYFSNLQKIHIPGVWTRCTYSGSGSGTGPACGAPPPTPTCVENDDGVAVSPGGAEVDIGAEQGELIVDFPGSEEPGCGMPLAEVQKMSVLGGSEDDSVTVDLNRALIDLFRDARPGLGINLGGGGNELRLSWGDSIDRMSMSPMQLNADFPGFDTGLSVDANADGVPDIGVVNGGLLDLDLGGGDDRFVVDPLTKAILMNHAPGVPLISLDGAGGNDRATVAPLSTEPLYLGDAPAAMRRAARATARRVNVNLDGADGDSVEIEALRVERWSAVGSSAAEKIVAAGGAGTGAALQLPITILGKGGNDRLTGGAADDTLNGGPDRDVCSGGKGRDTASKCESIRSVP